MQRLKKTVVMVGMMGAGKTAVGTALARLLAVDFLDLDEEITLAADRSIAEIFERDGEAFFRARESEVLARLLRGQPCVLSTGGGAFLAEANRQMIHDAGVSVWLRADLDLLWQRVRHKATRPLLRTANPRGPCARSMKRGCRFMRKQMSWWTACPTCRSRPWRNAWPMPLPCARMCWKGPEMTNVVPVALGSRSYEVRIGTGLIDRLGPEISPLLKRRKVAVVTDETVAAHHLLRLAKSLESAGIAMTALALPPGEATKGWEQFTRCVEWLLDQKIERRDVVVAFGGGVVGDLVGFAAAVLRRGVRFVQIPTTLLAQVDSSVGGKTGINTAQGKNLVGAFHQPSLVLADIGALDSLPRRDLLAGYGEVVKYGLLGDPIFFDWLERNGPSLIDGDEAARLHAVTRSVEMKAGIVARDETEEGERALLNLGHTFCHALGKGHRLFRPAFARRGRRHRLRVGV